MEILEAIQALTCFATAKLQQIFHICKFLSIFFQIKCIFFTFFCSYHFFLLPLQPILIKYA